MFGDGQGSRYSWRAGRCRHFWWGRRWIGHIARADAAAAQAHRLVSHLVNAWRERRVKPEKRTHAKASMRTRARETGRRTDGFRERRERERERECIYVSGGAIRIMHESFLEVSYGAEHCKMSQNPRLQLKRRFQEITTPRNAGWLRYAVCATQAPRYRPRGANDRSRKHGAHTTPLPLVLQI